ncbi:MAG: chorismate synthase [Candidatus Hydrogenedentes bacterium]|nr:chorismate synthase [Candidatus Hydrogenedentota bacterium]
MLRYLTAGESHGRGVFCLLEGLPAGLRVQPDDINFWLAERQKGYGRGGRQRIEKDEVDVLAGIRGGITLGGPILMAVWNRDFKNWTDAMDPWAPSTGPRANKIVQPRPGHADLVGAIKYGHDDCRNILERASARETAGRVAAGALCRKFLAEFGVDLAGHVVQIGSAIAHTEKVASEDIRKLSMKSQVRCVDKEASAKMVEVIKKAKRDKDSLGGIVEVRAWGLPLGLGDYIQWDRKLDARISQAMMSIQAVKGVEIGLGFRGAARAGSKFHDEIAYEPRKRVGGKYRRLSNNLGGFEGSMTTGEEIVVRVMKKPISTLMKPLRSVNMSTHEPALAVLERSDTCAVPALAIIVESALAIVLAEAYIEKFGGNTVEEMKRNFDSYVDYVNDK